MEAFGVIGFCTGVFGTTLGLIAFLLLIKLGKEFEHLKKNLQDSGVLKDHPKPVAM